ncbi:MAG: ABC transporter substrate-binding protein [Bacteroidota bacterium]
MKHLLYLFPVLVVLFSCDSGQKSTKNIDYGTKYAKNFNIIEQKDYTEIVILNPDTKVVEKRYALVTKANPRLDHGLVQIQVPVPSVIALGGTDVGMMDMLKMADKIRGVGNMKYIYSPGVKQNFKQGKVAEVPDFSQMNPERVMTVSRLISYSGFGTPPANEDKLARLGVVCIPNYDWREIHPLGKAEWIKLFGLLFGEEERAREYFSTIEKEYLALEKSTGKFKTKPQVISGQMIGDQWYMPGADSYNAYLFDKAKSAYVGRRKKGTGSNAYTLEEVIQNYQDAEIWINPGFKSKGEMLLSNEKYKYFKAFETGRIYCYSHNINYFWERSAVEPQKVLSDMIQIFHAGETSPGKLYFYKKISE